MCDLCDKDPKKLEAARAGTLFYAERMEHMAQHLRNLVSGRVRPHDHQSTASVTARSLIRYLVEEWM